MDREGFGRRKSPAKEIIPGRAATLRISRMALLFNPLTRLANRWLMSIPLPLFKKDRLVLICAKKQPNLCQRFRVLCPEAVNIKMELVPGLLEDG